MVDWIEVGKLVVSAIGGGAVGAWFQGRNQDRVERQRQRERAAELVGIATQLHLDTAPKRVAHQVHRIPLPGKPGLSDVCRLPGTGL